MVDWEELAAAVSRCGNTAFLQRGLKHAAQWGIHG